MNIEPALVGKVAAAVRSERLKHAEPSDAVLALAAIRAIFDWPTIETVPQDNTPVIFFDGVGIFQGSYIEYQMFVGRRHSHPNLTHWLPMIPLPEVV